MKALIKGTVQDALRAASNRGMLSARDSKDLRSTWGAIISVETYDESRVVAWLREPQPRRRLASCCSGPAPFPAGTCLFYWT